MFYLDLLGTNGVLTVEQLRDRYWAVLRTAPETPSLVWTLLDLRSLTCRALLHLQRPTGERVVCITGLFVFSEECLLPSSSCSASHNGGTLLPVHEMLLMALASYADQRRLDIRINAGTLCQRNPLLCFLLSMLSRVV